MFSNNQAVHVALAFVATCMGAMVGVSAADPHDWDDLPGVTYPVPSMDTSQGVDFWTGCFWLLPAGGTCAGRTRVRSTNFLHDDCPDMGPRTMHYTYAVTMIDYIGSPHGALRKPWYPFAYFGGNVNIVANGDFQNLPDILAADGLVIGGCQVSIEKHTNAAGYDCGYLALNNCLVNSFIIGGQDLIVDGAVLP